jgi:hypothetical protein
MDCKQMREVMDLYVDGELSAEATAAAVCTFPSVPIVGGLSGSCFCFVRASRRPLHSTGHRKNCSYGHTAALQYPHGVGCFRSLLLLRLRS